MQGPDLQPCNEVLQALPDGEVHDHVRVLHCYPQCEVGVLLQLSTQEEAFIKKSQNKKTGLKGKMPIAVILVLANQDYQFTLPRPCQSLLMIAGVNTCMKHYV